MADTNKTGADAAGTAVSEVNEQAAPELMSFGGDSGGVDPDEYQHLLEDYSPLAPPSRHEVLEGRVLKISGADVFIDVGYKSDGVAPLTHFLDLQGNVTVRPGDVVEVMVDSGHTSQGYVNLSHEKASRIKIWDNLEKALEDQLTLSGRVLGRVKGGLSRATSQPLIGVADQASGFNAALIGYIAELAQEVATLRAEVDRLTAGGNTRPGDE